MHGLETGLLLLGGEPTVVVEATVEAEITAATAEVEFVIDIATETVVGPTTVDPLVDVVEHGENLDYIVDVSTTQTPARESIIYIGLGHLIMHFSLFIVFFL